MLLKLCLGCRFYGVLRINRLLGIAVLLYLICGLYRHLELKASFLSSRVNLILSSTVDPPFLFGVTMTLEQNLSTRHTISNIRVSKRNVYHQAGHVASIYLGNKLKNLPPVHFQIAMNLTVQDPGVAGRFSLIQAKRSFKMEGGRLIPDLPCCYDAATKRLTPAQKQQCRDAFEADVVNLLSGALAEAKYVALRDGEVFNANLVYLGALRFYGGSMDLDTINGYMECMMPGQPKEQEARLAELFLQAYSFINDSGNWLVVARLAETFARSPQEIFTCEELAQLAESTHPESLGFLLKSNPVTAHLASAY